MVRNFEPDERGAAVKAVAESASDLEVSSQLISPSFWKKDEGRQMRRRRRAVMVAGVQCASCARTRATRVGLPQL
jgi:hypothetical protein